eukprot:Nitzschia sp. Nitz4//scaffold266_size26515//19084//19884//NITZ4_008259-RA/size26515-processed-gene-0.23-mRNA-1//1//CDS//3329544874//7932//frame0
MSETVSKLPTYRTPTPEEIPACFAIEEASYPEDEAATLENLKYRLAQAEPYFLCTVTEEDGIIGCDTFEEESMSTHVPDGPFLAIHSVVVHEKFRRRGIASAMMKQYLAHVERQNTDGSIQSFILLAKSHLLGFYVSCGFQVNRPSPIVHGKELWYELERKIFRTLPRPSESWFLVEGQVEGLEEVDWKYHDEWVVSLRCSDHCIVSGSCDDASSLVLFLASASLEEALEVFKANPLSMKQLVEWKVRKWTQRVGSLQIA